MWWRRAGFVEEDVLSGELPRAVQHEREAAGALEVAFVG